MNAKQLPLPLVDAPESKAERMRRILSGDVGRFCQTAAKYFTEAAARAAAELAAARTHTLTSAKGPSPPPSKP